MNWAIIAFGALMAAACLASGWAQEVRPPDLTEFMADNGGSLRDEDGEAADWIEIWNPNAGALNLAGYALTDDSDDLSQWVFPDWELPPDSYLVVFASGKDRREGSGALHTNFRINAGGEYLALVDRDGETVLRSYGPGVPAQREGISYGRAGDSEGYFLQATPGAANGPAYLGFVSAPEFSVERGLFSEAFPLELHCATEGATISFARGGRDPRTGTIFRPVETYSEALSIARTTVLRALASKPGYLPSEVLTHSYLFPQDILRQPDAPEGYPATWAGVAADYGMDPEVVDHPAYSGEMDQALRSIRSMSLVMPLEDLFGPQGIYTNSTARGAEWEREGSVEVIHPDGTAGYQSHCGVRIHGFGWRDHSITKKHSFRLEFRREYGPTKMEYPLFPDAPIKRFDSIVLRSQGSRSWQDFRDPQQSQYIRDSFARDTARDMGRIDGHAAFVHLYLNGLYWGLYNPVERPDAEFAAEYFGGSSEEYDAINRRTTTNEAIDGDLTAYNEMLALAAGGLETREQYEALEGYLDIPDTVDYMLIHQYTTNRDGPQEFQSNNMRGVRKREVGAQYRFFVWDMEYSLWEPERNINIHVAEPGSISFVYSRLRANPEFRRLYGDHVQRHCFADGALTPDKSLERWNRRSDEIFSAILGESARWGDAKRAQPYTRDVEWMTERNRLVGTYFPQRTRILVEQLREAELYPEVRTPEFGKHGGFLQAGEKVTLTAGTIFRPQPGEIYYTVDGSDPRVRWTGEVSAPAIRYERNGLGIELAGSFEVKARLVNGGEWSALNAAHFTTGQRPSPGDLVWSEIHYRPAGPSPAEAAQGYSTQEFEFLELLNVSSEPVDLSGLVLGDGVDYVFDDGGIRHLDPGGRLLLVRRRDAFEARYGPGLPVAGEFLRNLGNEGDRLVLRAADGELLMDVRYAEGSTWPAAVREGHSLVLVNPRGGTDPNDPASWSASAASGGSPGVADPAEGGAQNPDRDGDGLPDWLEGALGLDPNDPNSGAEVLRFSVLREDRGDGELSYGRLEIPWNPEVTGVEVVPETSRDLEHWEPGAFRLLDLGGTEADRRIYEGRDPLDPGTGRLFVRLRAVRGPGSDP